MNNLWDQQLKESSRAFAVFLVYRDLGLRRSCSSTAKQMKMNRSAVIELSKRHNWQKRVRAWDAHVDKITQEDQIEAIKAMKKRQISLALKAQKVAEQGLEKLIKQIEIDDISQIRAIDLSKLLDTGCRLERLNRNEPEQNLEIKQQQNLDLLNEEELENMRKLVAKTEGK